MKVLIVEDDNLSGFMMEELLETLGVETELASSAEAALAVLNARPKEFALVFMDIHMPKMTGDQAVIRIRESEEAPPRDIPVIAVTADPIWADAGRQKAIGLTDYLPKPVNMESLTAICRRFGLGNDVPLRH